MDNQNKINCFSFSIQQNCINLIRLLAALQVMFLHVVKHLEVNIALPLKNFISFFSGVPIFFAFSGFLIWFSIERSDSYWNYLKKRFWRIYPELWLGVIIELISIIKFYGIPDIKSFLVFGFTQSTFFQFWTPNSLRGYGCGTPNGSLWTICVMIQFYLIVWFIYKLFHNKTFFIWSIGFIIIICINIVCYEIIKHIKIEILMKLYDQTIIRYFWLFYIGSLIAEFKNNIIPLLKRFWYLFLLLGLLIYYLNIDFLIGYYSFLTSIMVILGVIGFSFAFPHLKIKLDISYSIFIYHMIVVNIFIQNGIIGNFLNILIIFVLTLLIAFLSTITIGRWANSKKQR